MEEVTNKMLKMWKVINEYKKLKKQQKEKMKRTEQKMVNKVKANELEMLKKALNTEKRKFK